MGEKQVALREAVLSYAGLILARQKYERAMLAARHTGATFSELAKELELSEPAVRGFIRRAERRGSRNGTPRRIPDVTGD